LSYLDYNATTPVAPAVLEQMLPWMTAQPWNAASTHVGGRAALAAVEHAREQVSAMAGVSAREIIWTSGATEANNLAISGVVRKMPAGTRVLVSATEHKAVLDTAHALESEGYKVEEIPVDRAGVVAADALSAALDSDVGLVSIMLANNETGVIQPIERLSAVVREAGATMHTDATQAPGKMHLDLRKLGVDLASLSAHKFYGPKGVGALFVRRGVELQPQVHGGGHERGLRSGTSNVPGIVGMGAAAEEVTTRLDDDLRHYSSLVTQLLAALEPVGGVQVVGEGADRLPNTVNVRFRGADAEAVMANCPTLMVSSGSACTARIPDASHVLQAMHLTQEEAYECLRISVGRVTTPDEIALAAETLVAAVRRVRSLAEEG
jgi:cysteine desulfurase